MIGYIGTVTLNILLFFNDKNLWVNTQWQKNPVTGEKSVRDNPARIVYDMGDDDPDNHKRFVHFCFVNLSKTNK